MPAFGLNPAEYQDQLANARANSIDPNDPLPPGFFDGAVPALGKGFERGELEVANLFAPDNADLIHDTLDMAKPSPQATGWLGQQLYGLTSAAPAMAGGMLAGGPLGAATLLAASKGFTQAGDLQRQGVDPTTSNELGALEGATQFAGAIFPAAIGSSLLKRLASGAAMNAGLNATSRGTTSAILDSHGYSDMAHQYKALDVGALFSDAILGSVFGAMHTGAHTEPLPSEVDAALAASNAHNLEVDTAPGIPADLATRNAHVAAIDTATQQLLNDEPVNVGEALSDTNFVPKAEDPQLHAGIEDAIRENGLEYQPEMPAERNASAEAGGAAMISPTDTLEGSQEAPFHSTDSSPPSGVFAKATTAPSSLRGSIVESSSRAIGQSPAEPYHAINDSDKLLARAQENKPELEQHLEAVTRDIAGAHFEKARVKDAEKITEKIQSSGRSPDAISDYLGGRIVVDTPEALEQTLNALRDRSNVTHVDDFLDEPKNAGYRAVHMQIGGRDGLSAEVQIIPAPVAEAKHEAQAIYTQYRRREIAPDELDQFRADVARSKQLFDDAWQKWTEQADHPEPASLSPAQQIAAERPDLAVATEDGTMTASEALTRADEDIARAKKESGLFDVAINCFLRYGDEG